MRRAGIVVAGLALLVLPASASADPKILSAGLEQSSLTGVGLTFAVEASDPKQGVTSLTVGLPDGVGAFGESACRVDRHGREHPAPGLGAGKRARLAFPWQPVSVGIQTLDVTVTSGACGLAPKRAHKAVKVNVGLADLPPLPAPRGRPKVHTSQGACPDSDLVPAVGNLGKVRAALRCLLNLQRGIHRLGPLHANRRLRTAAVRHSKDMLRRGYFDHQGPGGPTLPDRLRRAGYWPASAAENLGMGTGPIATPLAIVLAWLDSDAHRENILERSYDDVGIGVAVSTGRIAYTVDFGSR